MNCGCRFWSFNAESNGIGCSFVVWVPWLLLLKNVPVAENCFLSGWFPELGVLIPLLSFLLAEAGLKKF